VVVSGFLPNCYKTHTCTGEQRQRGEREGGEGGRRVPLPPNCYKTHTFTGGHRERKKDRGREGGVIARFID